MAENKFYVVFGDKEPFRCPIEEIRMEAAGTYKFMYLAAEWIGEQLHCGVKPHRCCDPEQVHQPLSKRKAELTDYQKQSLTFIRNTYPLSNFYQVGLPAGQPEIVIKNQDIRSLRFSFPDGTLCRVPAGCEACIFPADFSIREENPTVLIQLDANSEHMITSAKQKNMDGWKPISTIVYDSLHVDGYLLDLTAGDDLLGRFEALNGFAGEPALQVIDCSSFGCSQWLFQNQGSDQIPVRFPDGRTEFVPADGKIHHLSKSLIDAVI